MKQECDLILLTWNHRETTQKCLDSLFTHTDLASRLVIVDNGSDEPGTKEYLQTVQPRGNVREVVLIRNEEDLGFSKGMNVGLRFSLSNEGAPYLCLLSNDTVVTDGWLSELVRIASSNPAIGLLNPNSTNFGFYPPDESDINKYGARITRSLKGKWKELASCIGFCLMAKRSVFEKVGLFDEGFGMAYYEDTDLSKRAQSAGYLCALAEGSYVYHEQGASLGKHPEQKSPLFLKNEEIFYSRWGMSKPGRISYILGGKSQIKPEVISHQIRKSANQFNKVWVFYKDGANDSQLPNHWNVQKISFRGPSLFFYLWSLVCLLMKKKKFNRIYVDNSQLAGFLKKFQEITTEEEVIFKI